MRAAIDDAELQFTTTPEAMAGFVYGKLPLDAMEAEGALSVTGSRKKALAFQNFFELPPKAASNILA